MINIALMDKLTELGFEPCINGGMGQYQWDVLGRNHPNGMSVRVQGEEYGKSTIYLLNGEIKLDGDRYFNENFWCTDCEPFNGQYFVEVEHASVGMILDRVARGEFNKGHFAFTQTATQ